MSQTQRSQADKNASAIIRNILPFASASTPARLRSASVVGLAVATLISGCSISPTIKQEHQRIAATSAPALAAGVRDTGMATSPEMAGGVMYNERLAAAERSGVVARRASSPWVGSRLMDATTDGVLPPIFNESFRLRFDDAGSRVPLAVVAERLTRMTRMPVRISQDVYNASAATGVSRVAAAPTLGTPGVPMPAPMPGQSLNMAPVGTVPNGLQGGQAMPMPMVAGQPFMMPAPVFQQPVTDINSVEMNWDGTLSGFLNHLTSRLNLSWNYRDNTIVIERYMTESFELSAFVGQQDFRMSLSGGNTSSSDGEGSGKSSANMNINESGKLAALESLRNSIESMVKSHGGSVILNEGTGRMTVTAPRDVMSRVRDVVRAEDAVMQRQAIVQIDVYSVTTSEDDERGVNWNVVFQDLAGSWGATLSTSAAMSNIPTAQIGLNILSGGSGSASRHFGDSSVMLNLLNKVGTSAKFRPVSMVAMNRQWARQTNLMSTGYVSETVPGTSSSAGVSSSVGLKTDTITVGDKFMVQPAILDNGSVMLRFGMSLSELLNMLTMSAGSGSSQQTVQMPVTTGTDNQWTVRLDPGQAMIVSGLSRRTAGHNANSIGPGVNPMLGGSVGGNAKREDFVIVVRAMPMK